MKRFRTFLCILALLSGISAWAQHGVSIGNWRTHMPYQNVIGVEKLGS